MATLSDAYQGISSINLWFKVRSGDSLLLSDVPAVIPLRWPYFRDNWDGLYPALQSKASSYQYPDLFNYQLSKFSEFVTVQRTNINPITNPLSGSDVFYQFYTVFDNINISSIRLTNQEQVIVNSAIRATKNLKKTDFLSIKSSLAAFRDRQADVLGLTDATYNSVFNRSAINAQVSASIPDIMNMLQLNNTIKSIDFILANLYAVDAVVDPFTLARQNANNPDVNIINYSSGTLVRFNYGESLESLAKRYLGDPNLWINIAIANGLKPPYIDEIGKTIYLKTNGGDNTIVLPQFNLNGEENINSLYVNQSIIIQSNTQPFANQRTVMNIIQVPVSGDILVTLDGPPNLGIYATIDQANIRVFAPSTINSSQFILIPSQTPLPNERQETVPWFLEKSADDEKRAGIDLNIGDNGDLTFASNGDYSLSYGLENAMQAVKLKLSTEMGELRYHEGFGLVNIAGNVNRNVDSVRASIIAALNNQISQDSRFDRIESLSVDYVADEQSSPKFVVNMQIRLAGGSKVIPISFNLNNT